MAMAGRLMARRMKGRGHSPAASWAELALALALALALVAAAAATSHLLGSNG